jgi:adenylate kinase family enzyme
LKAYYEKRSLLKSIDGVGTIDEIFERITSVLSYV